MTTTRLAAQQLKVERFPVFPPRGDMLNPIHLHLPGHQTALIFHFGDSPTTLVLSEVPIGWRHDQSRRGILIPDLLVVFDVDRDAIIDRRGYAIEEWGKPPDFVLEVASPPALAAATRPPSARAMRITERRSTGASSRTPMPAGRAVRGWLATSWWMGCIVPSR